MSSYQQAMNAYRALLVRSAISRAGGSRRRAVKALGMAPANLRKLIKRAVILDLPERGDLATRFARKDAPS